MTARSLPRRRSRSPSTIPGPAGWSTIPEEIWATQLRCCRLALEQSGVDATELAAVGIANQRETVLLWDAETGAPLGNAIGGNAGGQRSAARSWRRPGWGDRVAALTGLRLDPYFSATKLEWLLANRPDAADLLRRGRLRAGTMDSFLVWRLTGGRSHVTDFSNASRTMLLDLERLEWADELLDLFGLPAGCFPSSASSGVIGATDPALFGAAVPIAGMAGDQQAALFGQGGLEAGDSKNTYGTGCFLLVNTGDRPAAAENGLLSTVAWVLEPPAAPAADPWGRRGRRRRVGRATSHVCPGRLGLHGRGGGPVAARRPGPRGRRGRDRPARRPGARQRRMSTSCRR